MKIQAKNDLVIVKELIKQETTNEAGIVIPSTVRGEPQKYGLIDSIGEEVTNFKVGETVIFHQSAGQAIILNGTEIYRVLKKAEIYGVVIE